VNTRQSDSRVPGRPPPASFGREGVDGPPSEDFSIRGGQAFHLVLHVDVTPSVESLDALRQAVAATTRQGVLEGFAAAYEEMEAEVAAASGPGPDAAAPGEPASGST